MSHQRGTTTDQLGNVIQVIQLGRKTGLLTVVRGEGKLQEKGEVFFVRGQITDVRSGQLQGHSALNWLRTWRACRFTFMETENSTGPLPQVGSGSSARLLPPVDTNPRLPAARLPQENAGRGALGQPNGALPAVPRRTGHANEGMQKLAKFGLSRSHRHLFLLIDGQRSVQELVRLMGHRAEEVQKLLHDLEVIGVIRQ